MTISTPHTNREANARPTQASGFTLAEVMIATTLSTLILAGVLSAFLMIGRTGYAASSYSEMEAQMRRALDVFGGDARKATDIRWIDGQTITLFVETPGAAPSPVTYAYDYDATSPGYRSFYRLVGDPGSAQPRMTLARNVATDFSFARFKLEQPGVASNAAANDLETKQIQVTLRATRTGATTVAANQSAFSARYVLRNKRVSN